MTKNTISPNNIYELTLPNEYLLKENKGITIIYNEVNGNGAINITSYHIPTTYNFDISDELRDFANSIDKTFDTQNLKVTINEYAWSEFISENTFWKIWAFFKNHHAVFMSYNCDKKDKTQEISTINKIAESLEIIT